jgi:hypothetical protein
VERVEILVTGSNITETALPMVVVMVREYISVVVIYWMLILDVGPPLIDLVVRLGSRVLLSGVRS